MADAPLRYKRLIQELPKHKTATDAIRAAGFSESVATTQQKRVLRNAIKYQAKDILETGRADSTARKLMTEIIGMSREEVFERLRYIATQEKDLSSALKVLAPLVKEHGVDLKPEDENGKVTVPVLNVVVNKKENENG